MSQLLQGDNVPGLPQCTPETTDSIKPKDNNVSYVDLSVTKLDL